MTAAAQGAAPAGRLVLVLNNPFLTDSRTWKIARSATEAGLRVTIVARAHDTLPADEERDGFRVLRVAQPRILPRLPAPRLPGERAAPRGGLVARLVGPLRETLGRAVQAVRYLLMARRWAADIAAVCPEADIWQAEGLVALPVALHLRRRGGGRVVYDARDIDVESGRFARLPTAWRRLLARRERRWAQAADAVVTVSEPYASVLRGRLGVEPVIVMNCQPRWAPPEPRTALFHERLGLAPGTPVVLYLGQVVAHRGLEQLFEAIGRVERVALVVVGFGDEWEAYRHEAAALPHADRVHLLPGLEPERILDWTAAADVSAMPVQPSTLNHRLNTPTKLFDAMAAGTPVVASDLPGMAPIVRETGCGVLCDPTDPADIARALREILDAPAERRTALRQACLSAAGGTYSWERQSEALLGLYRRLLARTT
jgi:glycosyltransferase involved in cell wall biosynthesis